MKCIKILLTPSNDSLSEVYYNQISKKYTNICIKILLTPSHASLSDAYCNQISKIYTNIRSLRYTLISRCTVNTAVNFIPS